MRVKRSLRSWLWRVPLREEVDEELAFHLEMRTRELIDRGWDPAAARDAAASRLGDVARVKRACINEGRKRDREMRLTRWMEELGDDVTFALRQLRRAPAFAGVAALTLALGIGANSAIFALVDATLLRPLPFPNPDRLVMLLEQSENSPRDGVSPANLLDWRERSRTLEAMGGFVPVVGGMVMPGADGVAETVPRQWVTAGVFDALDVRPVVGRTFLPSDNDQRANVVVLSEAFWRARFDGDPEVVGRDIRLDGELYTIVGVVPRPSELVGQSSIWALAPIARTPQSRQGHFLKVIGRLKPGVTVETAREDMAAVAAGLAREYPQTNAGRGVVLEPLHDAVIGSELRLTSMLFLGVVGIVLLICCANVANLLLARSTVRARELAIRAALGAGPRRIVRQLLTESLVLSALGCVLGVAMGAAILNAAPSFVPEGLLPGAVTPAFDLRVVAFSAAAALLVGLLFGLAPAWQASSLSAARVIASGSRTVTARGGRLRSLLVVGEVATAVLLLFGAGLLLRTLLAVENVDRGYGAERVLTMYVDPLGSQYPTDGELLQFFGDIEREVRALPGVREVAWATTLPLGPSTLGDVIFEVVGNPPVERSRRPIADYQIVSHTYFAALELPIVAGRGFDEGDREDSIPVCIVNEAFVRKHIQGGAATGQRVAFWSSETADVPAAVREIVGVARQVKGRPDEAEELVQVYVPLAQNPLDDINLVVRPVSGPAEALAPSVRAAIGRIDREQLVSIRDVMTLEDVVRQATSRHRFRAVLVMTFAALALLLAMVGVFGILAYSVQQRVRDFGVRRALGATTSDVFRLVAGSAARVVAVGAVIGLALSVILGRLIATVLFGVEPLDMTTFAAVLAVLALTAAVSAIGPAWRAARIDPATALRTE